VFLFKILFLKALYNLPAAMFSKSVGIFGISRGISAYLRRTYTIRRATFPVSE
jgi:hypothetical protein